MLGYTNIPATLCQYALVNKKINELKLYIYLKINSNGEIGYNRYSFSKWAKKLDLSSKTVKNSLAWLIKSKWITVNSIKGTLKIIGYKRLSKKLNLKFKSGYLFEPINYKYFKAMCCGVVITYYMDKKRYFSRQSGNKKGFATLQNCKRNNGFYSMPNNYLAKCLNVSLATAYRYKKEAETGGFIETKPNFSYIENEEGKRISSEYYNLFITVNKFNEEPNILRKTKRSLKKVEADLIHSYIVLKKKNLGF